MAQVNRRAAFTPNEFLGGSLAIANKTAQDRPAQAFGAVSRPPDMSFGGATDPIPPIKLLASRLQHGIMSVRRFQVENERKGYFCSRYLAGKTSGEPSGCRCSLQVFAGNH
jgi:hypothetical protein